MELRNRAEYWLSRETESFWRIRQRLRLSSAQAFGFAKLQPYAAAEYFYNFTSLGLKTIRLYFGTKLKPHALFQIDLFYCLQHSYVTGGELDYQIVGTAVNIFLKNTISFEKD